MITVTHMNDSRYTYDDYCCTYDDSRCTYDDYRYTYDDYRYTYDDYHHTHVITTTTMFIGHRGWVLGAVEHYFVLRLP